MAGLPLLPRVTLHFLTAFFLIAFLLIVLFPTLSYARSVYRPNEDSPTIIAIPPDPTASPSVLLKFQQQDDNYVYSEETVPPVIRSLDPPTRITVWNATLSTLRIAWTGITYCVHLVLLSLRPLQIVTTFLFNKLLFLLQPFIILGTGLYTITIVWPMQLITYLTSTLYPLYIFLACASIVGLLIGGLANFTTTFLNNTLFPHPPPKPLDHPHPPSPRPKTTDSQSQPDSLASSGSVTPLSLRAPPPSKYSSALGMDEFTQHILDTNALFTSFSLPAPPPTPPGLLYSAPTPAGSVIGETIFEEDDDSDDKTPVASVESWRLGAGKPLSRPESAHERIVNVAGREVGSGMGTWHGQVKREDVSVQGMDWGNDAVRKRKGVAV